jgi:hypothetical protein
MFQFFLLWNLSSEPSLFVGFFGIERIADFSISYSSLKGLIACFSFRALEIA